MSDEEIKIEATADEETDTATDLSLDEIDGQITDKLKKLKAELKACEEEKREYLAGWQRAKADYINLKKDLDKERGDYGRLARESVLHELLPLSDSFELAFANKTAWAEAPANWRQGVEYIYQQLQSVFQHYGLEIIDPLHQTFNPEQHESLGFIKGEAADEGRVLEVLKKGYILGGKVLRPAQVKVGEASQRN